jgi:hypothetical protein
MLATMGVHVHLAIVEDRVSEAAWHRVYEKMRRVAKQWSPRPLSVAWRQIGAVQVAQYTLDIESGSGLHIVGDAESLTIGESFQIPARLGHAPQRDRASSPATSQDDVLVAVACEQDPEMQHPVHYRHVFGAKTQRLPFHTLMVALGLVAEHSLPGTAVVYGDISPSNGREAQRAVASILGEEVELPVIVDIERMRRRLASSMTADAIDKTIRALCPEDPYADAFLADMIGLLRRSSDARVRHELEHVVLSCRDPDLLAPGTRLLLRSIVEAIRSGMVRGEIRERVEQWGAALTRELFARGTLKLGVRLTSMAWDAIESADLEELAFLYAMTGIDATSWDVHHAVRALLENRALRRA